MGERGGEPADDETGNSTSDLTGDPTEGTEHAPQGRSLLHRLTFVSPILLVCLAAGAWAIWTSMNPPRTEVSLAVPTAPQLTPANADQKVYRIDATRSKVSYDVDEILAGNANTAHGVTAGVAGDILIDERDPAKSQLGEIVVNVEQLTSDQEIRDNRIRHDFLESTHHPLARLKVSAIEGLPGRIEDAKDYALTLRGDLVVKDIAKPVTLTATASRRDDTLHVKAATTVKLTDYGIGPISLGPLVSTGDAATLTIDATAINAVNPLPYTVVAAAPGTSDPVAQGGPSFAKTVQPILERNCASCHNTGQSGASVWKLDTAGDAAKVAKGLGPVTASGYMPPWPASEVGIPLQHERRMSDADVKAVADWAAANGPLDVDAQTKIAPPRDDVEAQYQIRHDLDLTPTQPYQGSTARTNDYRCFVFDPKFADTTFITGMQFLPQHLEIAHHALVFKVDASMHEQVQKLDDTNDGAGWPCLAGMAGPGGQQSPDGTTKGSQLSMVWVPGQRPYKLPAGSGIKMAPKDFLVVQVHYHFGHEAPADQSTLAVETSSDQGLDEVRTQTYLGPAEIPCKPDEQGPQCDRATVLKRLDEEFGPSASYIANGLMLLCGKKLEDFKTDDQGIATSSCDHRIRAGQEGEVIGVLGHEHQLGRTFRMTLNPGTPDEKILLDIPHWDFQWQMLFAPQEKIVLKKGDTLRIECSWDRDLQASSEPSYVTWAEGTEDEMCYSAVTQRLPKK